jgi:hypothetical protein
MGWIAAAVILILLFIFARGVSGSSSQEEGPDLPDDQDPENPLYAERQEELFDEYEDDDRL